MIEAAMVVNLIALLLTMGMATAVVAQERNTGGRLENGGHTNTERAPEGTRERPARRVPSHGNTGTSIKSEPVRPVAVESQISTWVGGGFIDEWRVQRPAFYSNVILLDCRKTPDSAGISFADLRIARFTDESVDMYYENKDGDYTMGVYHDTDIQDLGSTNSLFECPVAPVSGWSERKEATLWERHMYAVRTWDQKYVKFRVRSVDSKLVVFDWMYQEMNREAVWYTNESSVASGSLGPSKTRFPR